MADVVLNLTKKEAFILRLVLDRVGGDVTKSDREHTHKIVSMLIEQGVEYDDDYDKVSGQINFHV